MQSRARPGMVRLFCLVLRWSGGRISEVLAHTPAAIDTESGVANIETLKRRRRGIVRRLLYVVRRAQFSVTNSFVRFVVAF